MKRKKSSIPPALHYVISERTLNEFNIHPFFNQFFFMFFAVLFLTNFDKVTPKHMETIKYVMSGAGELTLNS